MPIAAPESGSWPRNAGLGPEDAADGGQVPEAATPGAALAETPCAEGRSSAPPVMALPTAAVPEVAMGGDPATGEDVTGSITIRRCATCSGEGVICFEVGRDEHGDVVTDTEECEACHGSGMTADVHDVPIAPFTTIDGTIPTEESVHRAVAQTVKRPEDNYIAPTEARLKLDPPAPPRKPDRVLDAKVAAKLPRRPAPATTVEAYNREPAFAADCQIPTSQIEPGPSRRKSRLPAYQRDGKRARAVGRAMLRQIEADKAKAAKRAAREARERAEHEARERAMDDAAIPSSALDMIDFTGPNPLGK